MATLINYIVPTHVNEVESADGKRRNTDSAWIRSSYPINKPSTPAMLRLWKGHIGEIKGRMARGGIQRLDTDQLSGNPAPVV